MEELISEEQCKKILKSINPGYTFKSHEVKRLEEESMGGLIGHHFKLHIEYEQNDKSEKLQLFVKTLNKKSGIMYRISTNLRMFEKESLFLMKLLPLFAERGIDVSFAPRGYLCENDTVVIEDLSLTKFKLFPKTKPLDLEHCYGCLAALAKFHVSSIVYEICRSKSSRAQYSLLEDYPELLKDLVFSGSDNDGALHVETALAGLLVVAKLEFGDNEELSDFEHKLCNILSNEEENSTMRNSLLHGDLWSNNFLHRYEEDKLVETKLIDFQILKYGPPELDVLQFIYSNTRKKFRDEYFDHLLKYYYDRVNELLHERALSTEEILPKEEFFGYCEKLKETAKLQSTLDRCITSLPDEAYFDLINLEENLEQFMFGERGRFLIGPYQSIPGYKDIIGEDLRELREMLRGSG